VSALTRVVKTLPASQRARKEALAERATTLLSILRPPLHSWNP
jgi:hypothetical protein